jgi:hypothetical protein
LQRRQNTTYANSETTDKSDDEILSFSGTTRWQKDEKDEPPILCSIQEQKGSNLELIANNISKLLKKVPNKGYDVNNILQYGSTYRRAKELFIEIINQLCECFIPVNPSICYKFLKSKSERKEEDAPLNNLVDLYLIGESTVSQVCAAVISQSMSHDAARNRMKQRENTMVMSKSRYVKEGRSTFGKYKFNASRHLYSKLMIGKPVPRRFYAYRVQPERISTSIQFLQG